MVSNVTSCLDCGHDSEDPEWCDNCGASLTQGTAPALRDEWLEPGDELSVPCSISSLGQKGEAQVTMTLRLDDVIESSSVRHISYARFVGWTRDDAAPCADAFFMVEELGSMLGAKPNPVPGEVTCLIRAPISESMHKNHRVRVFLEDRYATLEEVVALARHRLDMRQLRGVFTSILDTVEALHQKSLLYLRLSPWTLRVHPALVPDDEPLSQMFWEHECPQDLVEADDAPTYQEDDVAQRLAFAETVELSALDIASVSSLREDSEEGAAPSSFTLDTSSLDDAGQVYSAQSVLEEEEEKKAMDGKPSMLHGLESEDTDAEEAVEKSTSLTLQGFGLRRYIPGVQEDVRAIPALLDGGFRLFALDEEVEEVPVVMGFSPPEMFGRTRAHIGVPCDVFSLGMILYYLISGELPPTSVYTRHIPSLPSRNFRPDFPIGMHSVIARATRPDPRDRFANVDALRHAFTQACESIDARLDAITQGMVPRIELAVDRHIGIAKRKRNPINQDHVFGAVADDGRFALVVVADGVSTASYGSGDLASEHLVRAAAEHWDELLPNYLMDEDVDAFSSIQMILSEANERIVAHVNSHWSPFEGNPHEVMGTTALVAVIQDGVVTLGSLGDSRGYVQRGASMEQVTIDHNLWTLSVLEGMPADNALALPHGDALAKCLGSFYVEDKMLVAVEPQPDIFRFPVMIGDALLLTTDGLIDFAGSNMLHAEDNILSLMLSEEKPDLACLEMILLANRGGGGDNIGVGVVRFV